MYKELKKQNKRLQELLARCNELALRNAELIALHEAKNKQKRD